jgi:hypothetical protein
MKIIIEITANTEELTDGLDRLFRDDIDFREHVLTALRKVARQDTSIESGVSLQKIMVEAELEVKEGQDG